MKVLCAADLHLGRRSSRLPETQDSREHSCAGAWEAIVDIALNERVDLVALSGDVIDRENRYFESIGPLERGVRELAAAEIPTFVVTGNHDFDVLPQVAETLDSPFFKVLGSGGIWDRHTIERDGRPVLHVDGWSFPRQVVRENPTDTYDLPFDEIPVLGLLHADLDQIDSRYAPVRLGDLRRFPVALWALGHIHAPATYEQDGTPPVIYPGSPQAMDPGETGVHGAIIVEIEGPGAVTLRTVPASSVQYATLEVDLTGVDTGDAVRNRLVEALRGSLAAQAEATERLRCISHRVRLTGRTPLHAGLRAMLESAEEDLSFTGAGGVEAVVERIDYDTRPALDLDTLRNQPDLRGELARIIQALESEQGSGEYQDLFGRTLRQLRELHQNRTFVPVSDDDLPDEDDARKHLLSEAWTLLDTLTAQQEAA